MEPLIKEIHFFAFSKKKKLQLNLIIRKNCCYRWNCVKGHFWILGIFESVSNFKENKMSRRGSRAFTLIRTPSSRTKIHNNLITMKKMNKYAKRMTFKWTKRDLHADNEAEADSGSIRRTVDVGVLDFVVFG